MLWPIRVFRPAGRQRRWSPLRQRRPGQCPGQCPRHRLPTPVLHHQLPVAKCSAPPVCRGRNGPHPVRQHNTTHILAEGLPPPCPPPPARRAHPVRPPSPKSAYGLPVLYCCVASILSKGGLPCSLFPVGWCAVDVPLLCCSHTVDPGQPNARVRQPRHCFGAISRVFLSSMPSPRAPCDMLHFVPMLRGC